ncbi:MAG: hypothetical protein AABX11_05345 [Nanoarchaeota archaeon]
MFNKNNIIILSLIILFIIFLFSFYPKDLFLNPFDSSGCVPYPNGCVTKNCKSVTIICNDNKDSPSTCNRYSCKVTLPVDICDEFNLTSGSSINPSNPFPIDIHKSVSINTDRCILNHELSHALDSPDTCASCKSEQISYNSDRFCLQEIYNTLCVGNPLPAGCESIPEMINEDRINILVSACLCSNLLIPRPKSSWSGSSVAPIYKTGTCESCFSNLKENPSIIGWDPRFNYLNQTIQAYCTGNEKE